MISSFSEKTVILLGTSFSSMRKENYFSKLVNGSLSRNATMETRFHSLTRSQFSFEKRLWIKFDKCCQWEELPIPIQISTADETTTIACV